MANVTYVKRYKSPTGNKLLFRKTDSEIVSEVISLKYKIKLLDIAPKPIELIRLSIKVVNPLLYEIVDHGEVRIIDFENKSEDFVTDNINLRVRLVNHNDPLDLPVYLDVQVMDMDEGGIKFPIDNYRFYTWIPCIDMMTNQSAISFFNA